MSLSLKSTLLVFFISCCSINAQNKSSKNLDKQEKTLLIDSIAKLVKKYYVSLEEGEKMASFLLSKKNSHEYNTITKPNDFANQLTKDLRSINGDLHMHVRHKTVSKNSKSTKPSTSVDLKGKWSNYGFQEINVLDGNIGYLKISHFGNWKNFDAAKKVIASSINSLKNTSAIIIDVRNNRGGTESMVAYLISYFFNGKTIHLSDYYYRYADQRYGVYTSENVPGAKLSKTPLYVLVNARTASAGESLAYMLKHLKRATIIGEVTAGAGNGALTHRVNDRFEVTISSETTINAITKTSFEKVGVIPTVKTSSDASYNTAYRMALEYLKAHNDSVHPSNYDKILDFISVKKETNATDTKAFQKYIGRYKGTVAEIIISTKEGFLYAEIVGKGGQIKLIPKGNHTFLVNGEKERIRFILNENNETIKLVGIDSPMDLKKVK